MLYLSLWIIQDEYFSTIQREAIALAGGGCYFRGNSAILDPAAAAIHKAKRRKSKSSYQPVKNEIQVCREFLTLCTNMDAPISEQIAS